MRSFKRILLTALLFAAVLAAGSAFFIGLFLHSEVEYYQDAAFRDSLSGSLDFLIVGSCQGKYAFVPAVIDGELGRSSYNLSGIHTSPAGERALLTEELDRNPVRDVIIDVDYDSLSYTTKGVHAIGDLTTVPRLRGAGARLRYFLENVYIEDYPTFYINYLRKGYSYFWSRILGTYRSPIETEEKGHWSRSSTDYSLSPEAAAEERQGTPLDTDTVEDNDKKLADLIRMCRERGIRVTLVMTPVTDSFMWTYSGWDLVHAKVQSIADELGVRYLDFNLYREKSSLLHDEDSFESMWHLSGDGSVTFTRMFAEIFRKLDSGEDIAPLFYGSYEEALAASRYNREVQ